MNLYRKKEYEKSQEVRNFEENGICFFERKFKNNAEKKFYDF